MLSGFFRRADADRRARYRQRMGTGGRRACPRAHASRQACRARAPRWSTSPALVPAFFGRSQTHRPLDPRGEVPSHRRFGGQIGAEIRSADLRKDTGAQMRVYKCGCKNAEVHKCGAPVAGKSAPIMKGTAWPLGARVLDGRARKARLVQETRPPRLPIRDKRCTRAVRAPVVGVSSC